jgi:hypothetical protein
MGSGQVIDLALAVEADTENADQLPHQPVEMK